MNKILKFWVLGLVPALALGFASCSDDDSDGQDTPNPPAGGSNVEVVFPNGLPASVDGAAITTNADGQVTSIKEGTEEYAFQYGTFTPSKAINYTVLMTYKDTQYPQDNYQVYMQLNKQGFVDYALQVYSDGDQDEWWFGYNSDGQLNYLKRTEGGDVYNVTYTNGDITSVSMTDEDGDKGTTTISYTDAKHTAPVANKGGIMLFDYTFNIDIDKMAKAYYAGLLGKATKNLPMGYSEKWAGDTEAYVCNFVWTLNSDNLPTEVQEEDDDYSGFTFTWK